jgi:hypothetical protein
MIIYKKADIKQGVYFNIFCKEYDMTSFWLIANLIDPIKKGKRNSLEFFLTKYSGYYIINLWMDMVAFCYYNNISHEEGLTLYLLSTSIEKD